MKRLLFVVAITLPLFAIWIAQAAPPATTEFDRTWARTDKPIADGQVSRSWNWGPEAFTGPVQEPYAEAPGGQRTVQYFDKARMEDNTWRIAEAPWDVTTGLLAMEMITGRMQFGDNQFEDRSAAEVNVAGDPDDLAGPTYASFANVLNAAPLPIGSATVPFVIAQSIDRNGTVTEARRWANFGIGTALLDDVTNHSIAEPFWAFMNASGIVYENGDYVEAPLFENPYFATGRPVTEAYWADIKVGGTILPVLMQCFERRCLTYTESNDPEWRIEMGNIGLHYYEWKTSGDQPAPPEATAPGQATSTTPAEVTSTSTSTSVPTSTATSPAPTFTATSIPIPTNTATSPAPPSNCHPSYPDHCIAPPPPDLNCPDLPSSWKPLRVLHNVPNPDPHDLDRDSDGWGCESG